MKTRVAVVLFLILCAGSATVARAVCVGASVNSFGAKGDGHTDDTAAWRHRTTSDLSPAPIGVIDAFREQPRPHRCTMEDPK